VNGSTPIEECQRLFEAAAPGNPSTTGWDRIIERDYARLDLAATRTVKFAYLYTGSLVLEGGKVRSEGADGVTLALYPGDTLTQARALYADPDRVQGLLGLREEAWQLRPNFHFGFMEKGFNWTTSGLEVEAYTAYWMERIHHLRAYPRDDWDAELARLIADGVFSPQDEAQFNADFRNTNRTEAVPRPAVAVSSSWDGPRSRDSAFPSELRAALRQVLVALREPVTTLDRDEAAIGNTAQSTAAPTARRAAIPALASRERIPERVRHEVWRRDQGRCVVCGSQERLEFDHIIPISRGGSNTARNIELRCEYHNRAKGAQV
jgi:hypothetical protein